MKQIRKPSDDLKGSHATANVIKASPRYRTENADCVGKPAESYANYPVKSRASCNSYSYLQADSFLWIRKTAFPKWKNTVRCQTRKPTVMISPNHTVFMSFPFGLGLDRPLVDSIVICIENMLRFSTRNHNPKIKTELSKSEYSGNYNLSPESDLPACRFLIGPKDQR